MYTVSSFSEYLAGRLYPEYNLTSTGNGYFYKPILQKNSEFEGFYVSDGEIDTIFKKEAISLIKAHPIKFITMGIFEIIKFNSFAQILLLNEIYIENLIQNPLLLSVLRGMVKLSGFFILIFAIIGMIFSYKERRKISILLSVIFYFNIIYFFLDSIGRYCVPIIPYYIFFCVLGIHKIMSIFKRKAKNYIPAS